MAQVQNEQQKMAVVPTTGVRLVSGALAGCFADLLTFPLDMAKVRLQIQGESAKAAKSSFSFAKARAQKENFRYKGVFGTISTIVKEEGPRGLYRGLNPGMQRQLCFCGVRIGLYDNIKEAYTELLGTDGVNIYARIAAGITSGGLAVVIAQPTDVVKVRLQAQGMNKESGTQYRGAYHAYKTSLKKKDSRKDCGKVTGNLSPVVRPRHVHFLIFLMWGSLPNITRNAVVTASELVSYDMLKEYILKNKILPDEFPCHIVSAFGAGFITTCVASPVDVVKTRFMNSPAGQYAGALNCAAKMFREGGPLAFYKGFLPNFMRLSAWSVVMFVSFEQLKRVMMDYKTRDTN
ncbi:mitochondrial uncoupling protein 3 [Apostichopus japonicus]|uniref:Mitochondrial uncoupling protein 3 n=1 Tax=Stichopus japonicus TaxID=307972 RepID=A0A2G8KYR2_STIJA|nr:mitochondrial uncoupling protein 3 [Apostichopus japonicus]